MVRQSRDGCSLVVSMTTLVPRMAPLLAGCDVIRTPSKASRESGFPDRRQGNAGIDQGAKDHVPAGARKRIEDCDVRQGKKSPPMNAAGALPGPRVKHSVGEARFRPC